MVRSITERGTLVDVLYLLSNPLKPVNMKTRHVESLEEMVFEKRNKLYGAYALRRKYGNHLAFAILVAIFILGSAVAYPVIASYLGGTNSGNNNRGEILIDVMPAPTPDLPPPPPPPPAPPDLNPQARFVPPKVVDSIFDDPGMGTMDDLNNRPIASVTTADDPMPDAPPPVQKTIEVPAVDPPVAWVEEFPKFPGGDEALYKFLGSNIHYPTEAKEAGISGTVYLTFVVEKNGSITNIAVLRPVEGGCSEEAVRVVKSMPAWSPGKHNGIPVRFQYNLPVKFTLMNQ
jgi:periplasmic protein TonB